MEMVLVKPYTPLDLQRFSPPPLFFFCAAEKSLMEEQRRSVQAMNGR